MGEAPGGTKASGIVAAGATLELTFSGLGAWKQGVCLVEAVLTAGAALAFSVQVRPGEDEDWYEVPFTDLTGADASALAATKAVVASMTGALFALHVPGVKDVKVIIEETGSTAGATITAWLLTD